MPMTLQALAAMTMDFCRSRVDGISPTTAYSTGPMKVEWMEKNMRSSAPVAQFALSSFRGAKKMKPMVKSIMHERTVPVNYSVRRPNRAINAQLQIVPKKPMAYCPMVRSNALVGESPACSKKYVLYPASPLP